MAVLSPYGYDLPREKEWEIRERPKYIAPLTVLLVIVTILALLPAPTASGSCPFGSVCWTGGAGDGKWEASANWSGPISEATEIIISLPFSGPPLITVSSAPTIAALTLGKGVTLVCSDKCKLKVEFGGATLSNAGNITNVGSITVEGGSATLSNEGAITNSGNINLEGGSAQIKNFGSIANSGSISVFGGGAQIINMGRITNTGTISIEGGGAEITNGGEILNCNGGTVSGTVTGKPIIYGCTFVQTTTTTQGTGQETTHVSEEAIAQGLVTLTTTLTRTIQVSRTQYSQYPISTMIATTTATNYMKSGGSFMVPAATSESCYWNSFHYPHIKGQRILGSIISNPNIQFYVMNARQFDAHRNRMVRTCTGYSPSALVAAIGIGSYNLDFLVPEDGDYYYVFWNPSKEFAWGTFSLWTEEPQVTSSLVFGTKTLVSMYTTTQTLVSVYSTKTSEPFSIGSYVGLPIIAVVAIVGVIAAGCAILIYRRTAHRRERAK